MKKVLIVLLLAICLVSVNAEKSKLARLHYSGGGDWYNDADAIPNYASFLNKNLKTDLALEEKAVKPGSSEIFDYPYIFMTGHGNISFSEKDSENLRKYLQRGGFLFADDDYGMDDSFRSEIKKVFPEKELIELPASHEIFTCFYNLKNGLSKIHKHDDKRPQIFAIFDDFGRIMVLYSYETNISDGWSNAHKDPQQKKDEAFHIGANIFWYMFTN
jgi:hypothetical protein